MKRSPFMLVVCALLAVLPAGAWANVPVPSMFGFMAPGWATSVTAGGAFAGIVLIEWVVLKWWLAMGWGRALSWVVVMNVVSSLIGLFASFSAGILLMLIAGAALCDRLDKFGFKRWKVYLVYLACCVLFFTWAVLSFGSGLRPWAFWGSLGPAFILSIMIEMTVLIWLSGGKLAPGAVAVANAGSYIFLVGVLLLLRMSPATNPMLGESYLVMHIPAAAARGESEQVREMVEVLMELPPPRYISDRDVNVARALVRYGYLEQARMVVESLRVAERQQPLNDRRREDLTWVERELEEAERRGAGP